MKPEIQIEYDKCVAAFKDVPSGLELTRSWLTEKGIEHYSAVESAWCCHHTEIWERLTEPWYVRLEYILSHKPEHEHAVRFRNFRPCTKHEEAQKIQQEFEQKRHVFWDCYQDGMDKLAKEYQAAVAPNWEDFRLKKDLADADSAELFNSYSINVGTLMAKRIAKEDLLKREYDNQVRPLIHAYQEAMLPLYKADVPEGTWNGYTIFG